MWFRLGVAAQSKNGLHGARDLQAAAMVADSIFQLTKQVEQLFRDAWPKAKRYPDLAACYSVAVRINIVKITPKPKKPGPLAALKHARLLLRHLPTIRQKWESDAQMYKMESGGREIVIHQRSLDHCSAVLEKIDLTERCVRIFLDACTPAALARPNPARFIAEAVRGAWQRVRGGAKVPKLGEPHGPLCLFVTAAMRLTGKTLSPETVYEMLRARRRRSKKSSKKSTPAPSKKSQGAKSR
jgi:hypothetical protein